MLQRLQVNFLYLKNVQVCSLSSVLSILQPRSETSQVSSPENIPMSLGRGWLSVSIGASCMFLCHSASINPMKA